jgi:uncharacterized protein (DUF1810 family)
MTADSFELERIVSVRAVISETPLDELRCERRQGHEMWFISPQLEGLEFSPTAQHFGITASGETVAYVEHPVLGPRLDWANLAVQSNFATSLNAGFSSPDDLKFRSSMTLFAAVVSANLFQAALGRWCSGEADHETLQLLRAGGEAARD